MVVPKTEYDKIVELMILDYYEDKAKNNYDILKLDMQTVKSIVCKELKSEGISYAKA